MSNADATTNISPHAVRAYIYQEFLSTGRAPSLQAIREHFGGDRSSVEKVLRDLHDAHHIVLQNDNEILAAHPFSNVAMPFDVTFGGVRAWGFCIWDALGIAAMSGQDAEIETRCADCLKKITLRVSGQRLATGNEYVAQFIVPAQRMWDDVTFTCSNQLPFCDVEHADRWRDRYAQPEGSILHMDRVWALANAWYGEDRRATDWRRRTVTEANKIFRDLGLETPFWHLDAAT